MLSLAAMDPADIVASFATNDSTSLYQVTRRALATAVRGRASPPSTSTVPITASVQPASGRDLLRLPELQRSNETRVVFTSTPLMIAGEGVPFMSDLVAIDGRLWEVQHVESWEASPMTDGAYYRVIVQATT